MYFDREKTPLSSGRIFFSKEAHFQEKDITNSASWFIFFYQKVSNFPSLSLLKCLLTKKLLVG